MRCSGLDQCTKLMSMAVKYVALLAFNRIVASHSHLVSMHRDVIMDCINDPDISIRLQALDLGAGMVNSDSLVSVVEHLMQQLKHAPLFSGTADDPRSIAINVEPTADSDEEDPEEVLKPTSEDGGDAPVLPLEYRIRIIRQIIEMCSKDTYANIVDFEWYIDVLMQLVKLLPITDSSTSMLMSSNLDESPGRQHSQISGLASVIGWEIRNVAVRVSSVRPEAVRAAHSLIESHASGSLPNINGMGGEMVLEYAAWIVGEYCAAAESFKPALDPLIHPKVNSLLPVVICAYVQAVPKILASLISHRWNWSPERQTMISLLVARVVHFLEPLSKHPDVEVQERSIEFLELMRVASQAVADHDKQEEFGPLLLTRAIPQLFAGFELNPVAPSAQRKVPLQDGLNLDLLINPNLNTLLLKAEHDVSPEASAVHFEYMYNQKPSGKADNGPALNTLPSLEPESSSYQRAEEVLEDSNLIVRNRIQRQERYRDDPFYIGNDDVSSGTSTPFHDILRSTNGDDVDVDSIPIMNLDLGDKGFVFDGSTKEPSKPRRKPPEKVYIAKDETLDDDRNDQENQGILTALDNPTFTRSQIPGKTGKSLLQVDSSGLNSFSLNATNKKGDTRELEEEDTQDKEMARALAEVERLRLEMQRASERVQATDGTPAEGTLVKKKRRRKNLKHSDEDKTRKGDDNIDTNAQFVDEAQSIPAVKRKRKKKKEDLLGPSEEPVLSRGR